jgi:hypothetical protein
VLVSPYCHRYPFLIHPSAFSAVSAPIPLEPGVISSSMLKFYTNIDSDIQSGRTIGLEVGISATAKTKFESDSFSTIDPPFLTKFFFNSVSLVFGIF